MIFSNKYNNNLCFRKSIAYRNRSVMANLPDGCINGCNFQWKIENTSHCCWWLEREASIDSPKFIADALGGTTWSLSLFPYRYSSEKSVRVLLNREKNCTGPKIVTVFMEIAFLRNDGLLLHEGNSCKQKFSIGDVWGLDFIRARRIVFFTEKEKYLPEDTLTVQCKIWNQETRSVQPNYIYARTTFKVNRRYFLWRIRNISTLKSEQIKNIKENFIDFKLVLNEGFDKLYININSFNRNVKYISCNMSILDSKGMKKTCGKYITSVMQTGVLSTLPLSRKLMENKTRYLPNDVLTLDFEFIFSTVEDSEYARNFNFEKEPYAVPYVGKVMSQNTGDLTEDMKSMYNNGMFSDTELRTATKTFKAHKNILSARSPVFRNMFSHDMMETNSGHVNITDFEDDTIKRMLQYMYTDSLGELQFESASELYKIADKYEILSLKSRCSSFLILNLCPKWACDCFVLANQYQDNDFTNAVQSYIIEQSYPFFRSQKWIDFQVENKNMALRILHAKACTK